MLTRLITVILFVSIVSLLIWQRFDTPPTEPVSITAISGSSDFEIEDRLKRGQFIETNDEFLQIGIGESMIALAANTRIELEDLAEGSPVVRLHKGRIFAQSDEMPLWITTDLSENVVQRGSATFVNYDFQESVHVIPIEGSVQTSIESINEYLLLPVSVAIQEGYNPGYEAIDVNLEAGESADFYNWLGIIDTQ